MDRLTAAVLTDCWLRAESSHEPVKAGAASVFGTCLSGPEEHSKKEGEDKNTLFYPTVYRALRNVEYENDPKVEEVLSHQHLILVLHDPLQVNCTSLVWSSS